MKSRNIDLIRFKVLSNKLKNNFQQCTRTYHLHCGITNGALNHFDKFRSYCAQHRTLSIIPPQPRPLCHSCQEPVSDDWIQCPVTSCAIGLHRHCAQQRANQSREDCPGCGNHEEFLAEMNFFGIWFRNFLE